MAQIEGNLTAQESLTKVQALKDLLVACATGREADHTEYRVLRLELLITPLAKLKLPSFVHTCRQLSEFWAFIQPKFKHYQERREFLQQEFEPLLSLLETGATMPVDALVSAALVNVDSAYVQEAWLKALERRTDDPEGAITAARTLLETVCKHILDESGVEYGGESELPKIYGLVAEQLNLAPSQHTEKVFRQILGSCQSVVEGLGALRNRLSDAHGKSRLAVKPAPRHAELAVNLAGSMASFLVATWEDRKSQQSRVPGT
ncbi:MAG: abortive infection family protein [Anaerolineae bacterium]|nr:abortive infection family protein [Anaerolineae bacterium]